METIVYVNPVGVGLTVFLLMTLDRCLTIAQQREVDRHYGGHYAIYPTNSIEGNPALRNNIQKGSYLSKRHLLLSLILSSSVTLALVVLSETYRWTASGYFVGLFLIVNTQHLSNLIGYYVGRKGVHGKIVLHQRTALKKQCGRYFSWSVLLMVLALATFSPFLLGVTAAAVSSSIRQLVWLKSVPKYNEIEELAKIAEDQRAGGMNR